MDADSRSSATKAVERPRPCWPPPRRRGLRQQRRSLLHQGPDGPVGHGWPRSVSVRLDTLGPLGLTLPVDTSHPANRHRTTAQLLMPAEIGRMLGCRIVPSAPLKAVLFPRSRG
ncbi:hypothetical protein NKH77_53490 [Streptomyces sp. M19]